MKTKRPTTGLKPYRVQVHSFMAPDGLQYPKQGIVQLTEKEAKRAIELKHVEPVEGDKPKAAAEPAPKKTQQETK
jgi:hypothetical protein